MENYTLLHKSKNTSSKEDISYFKKIISEQKKLIPEMVIFHLFLTKQNVDNAILKSFQDINIEQNKKGLHCFSNISRFKSVRNTLLFLSSYVNNKGRYLSEYKNISSLSSYLGINAEITNNDCRLIEANYKHYISENIFIFNQYLNSLHLDVNELLFVFSKISSYFLYILEEFKSHQKIEDSRKFNSFSKFKKTNSEKEMEKIILNRKGRSLEKRIIKSYKINTDKKINKNKSRSLIYHYINDRRVYKKIIWRENKKPKYYKYMPGFFDNIYSLSSLIDIKMVFVGGNNFSIIFLLKLISLEMIVNQYIINKIGG